MAAILHFSYAALSLILWLNIKRKRRLHLDPYPKGKESLDQQEKNDLKKQTQNIISKIFSVSFPKY